MGLIPHIIDKGCDFLQYVDDIVFLIQDNLEYAINLKFILILFEQMSGLKINFQKVNFTVLEKQWIKKKSEFSKSEFYLS